MAKDSEKKTKSRRKTSEISTGDTPPGKNGGSSKKVKKVTEKNHFTPLKGWNCKYCNKDYQIEDDPPAICDRCEGNVCYMCSLVSASEFSEISRQSKVSIWCCKECKKAALSAIKADRTIEERCDEFMKTFRNELLVEMEQNFGAKIKKNLNLKLSL